MVSGGRNGSGGRRHCAAAMAESCLAAGGREVPAGHCRGAASVAGVQRRGVWERVGVRERPILGQGDRAARRRAQSRAPQCPGRSHLLFKIGAAEHGGRELGTFLAGGGRCGFGNRSMEAAGAIGADAVAMGSTGVLRAFDCIRLGANPCPHMVAVCHLQPALRTPVVANVRGFDRSADGFCFSPWGGSGCGWSAWWETSGGAVGAGGGQLCVGVESGPSMLEGSTEELGDSESSGFCGGGGRWSITKELAIPDGTRGTCRRHAAVGNSAAPSRE